MRTSVLLGLSLFGLLILATPTMSYDRWELDFAIGKPEVVIVRNALGEGTPFLVFPFKVTNKTGKERSMTLSIIARSDTEKTVDGKKQRVETRSTSDARAQEALEKKLKRKLLSMSDIQGTIGDGETKEGLAVFRNPDAEMDRVEFRVHGLVDPIDIVDGKRYVEEKVLVLHYERPGDEFGASSDPLKFKKKEWWTSERRELPSHRD
jgi:hypothetical protein